jgi:DNA polymerase-3 subunit delta'
VNPIHPVHGHEDVRQRLGRSVQAGTLPGALLFHGPAGIGKQRLALWLGQRLLCTQPDVEPCGRCHACHLTLRLEHPDLHWFFPLPRPRVSGGADRMGEALEDVRAAELAARREQPFYTSVRTESVGLFVAHIQVLRRLAQSRPAVGPRKVFIIGDAEAMVPQEASPEAANALLKLLEEPPPDTTLVLTATDPESLLPTIRSRTLLVRIRPLPFEEVAAFLSTNRGTPGDQAATAARLSGGSIGRALAFLPDGDAPGPLEELRQSARTLLGAIFARSPAQGLAFALAQAPAGARAASFTGLLDFLGAWLRDLAAVDAGAEEVVVNIDALPWLRELASRHPGLGAAIPEALSAVEEAASMTQLNLNPQLVLAHLTREITSSLAKAAQPA